MQRTVKKFATFKEAEIKDIAYYVRLSVEERQAVARELQQRAYGDHTPDVRQYHKREARAKREKTDP